MERKRLVDSLCIGIEKIAEMDEAVQYAFVADVYEPDPEFSNRMAIVGQNRGVLQIDRAALRLTRSGKPIDGWL